MTQPKVLIVEDEFAMSRALSFLCHKEGFGSMIARDGHQAMELLEQFEPDLLILDLDLPYINGFDVCRQAKGEGRAREPIVIAVTASPQLDDRRRILALGADDFLSKPFDPVELLGRIRTLLAA